jgi:hypothetical protein
MPNWIQRVSRYPAPHWMSSVFKILPIFVETIHLMNTSSKGNRSNSVYLNFVEDLLPLFQPYVLLPPHPIHIAPLCVCICVCCTLWNPARGWTDHASSSSSTFTSSIFLAVFLFVCLTWVWTQGFVLAKQTLYCLSHTLVHFALVILEMGVLRTICPGWPWTGILQISASQVVLDYRHEPPVSGSAQCPTLDKNFLLNGSTNEM